MNDFIKEEHREFPPIVHVETTNVCNLKCIHCPQSDPYSLVPNYRPEQMDFDIFTKVVDEVAEFGYCLRMTPDGEPLMHRGFKDQLRYVVGKKVPVFAFNTNGVLLTDRILELILMSSPIKIAIEISLDALYKDTYDKIRVGSNYSLVMKNIFSILSWKNVSNVKVLVSCVRQPEISDNEIRSFVCFWEKLVDKVIIRDYVDTKGLTPNKQPIEINGDRWPCVVPFTRLVVSPNGDVRYCPDDWEKKTTIGNIKDNTLKEIWQSDYMSDLRENHLKGDFCYSEVCEKCQDWKAIKWDYTYLEVLNDLFREK